MHTQTDGKIKVGSIGTLYRVPVIDDDLVEATFDPSTASIKKIYFKMPNGNGTFQTVSRDASVASVDIDGVSTFCLTYVVVSADAAEFHLAPGLMEIEGYLEYPDGKKWRSDGITTDQRGRPLRIYPNL